MKRFLSAILAVAASAAQAGVITPPVQPRSDVQIVGSRGQTLGQGPNVGGSGSTVTRLESRYRFTVGCDSADVQIAYGNFTVGAGTGEADGLNAITLQAAIETTATSGTISQAAAAYPVLFGGAQSRSVDPGAYSVLSDVLGEDFARGDQPYVRTGVTIAAGQSIPVGMSAFLGGTAEAAYQSSNAASQIYGTGALAAGTNGTTTSYGYGPLALLGRPTGPCASVIVLGDSIADGQGDASGGDGNGNRGWIARGLGTAAANGLPIAYTKDTRPSDTPAVNTRSNAWRKRGLWKYANVLICEEGINQLVPTSQAAQLAYLQDIWLSAKRRHMQVWQTLITPQTTSTDGWATAANQTVNATFAANRAALNAAIVAAVASGQIDGVIDPNPSIEDQANPGKFVTNGTANYATTDGTHPTPAFHTAMVGAITAIAARLKASP